MQFNPVVLSVEMPVCKIFVTKITKKKRTMLRCPPFRILKSKITRQQEILYGENLQFYKYHHLAHLQRKQYYLPAYHLE